MLVIYPLEDYIQIYIQIWPNKIEPILRSKGINIYLDFLKLQITCILIPYMFLYKYLVFYFDILNRQVFVTRNFLMY